MIVSILSGHHKYRLNHNQEDTTLDWKGKRGERVLELGNIFLARRYWQWSDTCFSCVSRTFMYADKLLVSLRKTQSYTILHYLTLSYTILHYLTPSYTILHYLTLSYTILHNFSLIYTICFSLSEGSWCVTSYYADCEPLWTLCVDGNIRVITSIATVAAASIAIGYRCYLH